MEHAGVVMHGASLILALVTTSNASISNIATEEAEEALATPISDRRGSRRQGKYGEKAILDHQFVVAAYSVTWANPTRISCMAWTEMACRKAQCGAANAAISSASLIDFMQHRDFLSRSQRGHSSGLT
jgi:hypothetical protein